MTDTSVAVPPATSDPVVEACKRDRLKMVLSLTAMGYLTIFTGLLFFKGIPEGAAGGVADTLAGAAIMLVKDSYSFVFGSSQGSEDKNAQIATLSATPKS